MPLSQCHRLPRVSLACDDVRVDSSRTVTRHTVSKTVAPMPPSKDRWDFNVGPNVLTEAREACDQCL